MITHDLGVVANIAQKIAVMYSGIIVESGTCEDIFYRPRHPYTWALTRSVPRLVEKQAGTRDNSGNSAGSFKPAGRMSVLHAVQLLYADL